MKMDKPDEQETIGRITRREAIQRVSAMLGGIAFIGGTSLLTACERGERAATTSSVGSFSSDDIAYLDEVADTILPETDSPGAKAAKTGAFIALMVTDTYDAKDQQVFRDGMRTLEEECRKMHNHGFMQASPEERLALLERLDREQVDYTKRRDDARRSRREAPKEEEESKAAANLPDQRQEGALGEDVGAAAAITADSPSHYFRMMKELTLLGYFTSEIGCNQAQRYIESPGRFEPCVDYKPGEKAWAPHA